MLKAKALCAVNGNAAPAIRPLMPVMEVSASAVETYDNSLHDLTGLVSNVCYFSELQSLNGSLVVMPKAQMFLTGQYLEMAVYQIIKDVLQELSLKYSADFEIYCNVRVADREGKLKNEFDIAFHFKGIWYIVECKSGKCFFD